MRISPSKGSALTQSTRHANLRRTPAGPSLLFFEDFLDLADFLLDFPAHIFILAVGFQVGIIRQLFCLLLNPTRRAFRALGPVGKFVVSSTGEAYDARARYPNRKFRLIEVT